jgi:mono/diheme cytochrome c family protein
MKHNTAKLTLAAALAGGGILALSSTVDAQGIGLDEFKRMLVPTPRMMSQGEQIYQNQCSSCHGTDGAGASDYPDTRFANPVPNLANNEYRYGAGPVSVYNTITLGLEGRKAEGDEQTAEDDKAPYHPTYTDTLRYQERWAVTHFVRRGLGSTPEATDSPDVIAAAKQRAIQGTCDPSIKKNLSSRVEPPGEEMMKKAEQTYQAQCATCHGKTGKGDGPAGAALNPPARNFHAKEGEWVNGTSPFAIFKTLANGIEGAAMAAYPDIDPDVRWALAHYIRQWVPESKLEQVTDEQIASVCRTQSAPPPPEPISERTAQRALIEAQDDQRAIELTMYGAPRVHEGANAEEGADVFEAQCASCHTSDPEAEPKILGPYGLRRAPSRNQALPRLVIEPRPLYRQHAGGSVNDFAERVAGGVHRTLPDMTAVGTLTTKEWHDLHAYVAGFESMEAAGPVPTLELVSTVDASSQDDGGEQESSDSNTDGSETDTSNNTN